MEETGTGKALARVAIDETRWCRSCDVTVSPTKTSAYCPDHYPKRGLYLRREGRRREREEQEAAAQRAAERAANAQPVIPEGQVLVDRLALEMIAQRARHLATSVSRASEHYRALRDEQDVDWLDNLMWAAKHMDSAIASGITNGDVLPRDNVPQRALPAKANRRT